MYLIYLYIEHKIFKKKELHSYVYLYVHFMYLIILNCSHFLPPPTLLFSVNLDLKDISQEYVTKDQRKSYNPCWGVSPTN